MSKPNPPPPNVRPPGSTGLEQPRGRTPERNSRARIGKFLGWGFVALALVAAALVIQDLRQNPRSEMGIVTANVVGIAPRVSGPIKLLPLAEDQSVAAGDILFEIDPEPYLLAARVARADRDAIAGELVNVEKTIVAQKAAVIAAAAVLAQANTALAQAEESYQRIAPLLAKRFASAETVDTARHARDSARSAVQAARAQLESAEAAVQEPAPIAARLEAAEAALDQAELSVRDCIVRAPFSGKVAGLRISAGAFARAGIDVLTLIDTASWHVEMNFREGELSRIRPGDLADLEIMTAPRLRLAGEVMSVGWGVTDLPQLPLAGLPIVRRELDWVRLAQDFPVRIRLTSEVPPNVLRVGATAAATIHTRTKP